MHVNNDPGPPFFHGNDITALISRIACRSVKKRMELQRIWEDTGDTSAIPCSPPHSPIPIPRPFQRSHWHLGGSPTPPRVLPLSAPWGYRTGSQCRRPRGAWEDTDPVRIQPSSAFFMTGMTKCELVLRSCSEKSATYRQSILWNGWQKIPPRCGKRSRSRDQHYADTAGTDR